MPSRHTIFRLGILPLALISSFAFAENTQKITDINVIANHQGTKSKTNVVTMRDMDERTETDLRGLLKNEPSINFGGGNGTSQWVTIRGLGQDQIDIKVDGAYSDTQMFHHQGRFILDPALVKVIGVQKGTGSASAGIGATGGAIVATTVDADDLLREGQNIGFKVGTGYASNRLWSTSASVYGRSGMFDGVVAGNFVRDRNFKDGQGYRVNNSQLNSRGLLAKVGMNLNEDQRIQLSHRQERHSGTRNLREEFDFEQGNNAPNNSPRHRVTTQDTTTLEWRGKNMGFISRADANLYRFNTKRAEPNDPTLRTYGTANVLTYGANLNLDSMIANRHTLKYGINWRNQEARPPREEAGFSNQKKDEIGVYAEGIWQIDPVTLTTGLRYDHFNLTTTDGKKKSGSRVSPNVGLIWDVTDDLSLNTSLNYATRSPRMYEAALASGRLIVSDQDLKAERSRNVEIGFNYNWNNALSFNGSYFWQNIKDVQAYDTKTTPGTTLIYNGGTLKNNGYELGAAYRWRGLTARAGVAYSEPKLNGEVADSVVAAIPIGRTWTTGLSYQFETPNLEIGWRGRFVQSRTYVPVSNRGAGDAANVRSGYGVNDIYANWKPTGKDDLNVNFAINNVFDKYYRSHSQRNGINSLPGVGRDIRLAVNYRF